MAVSLGQVNQYLDQVLSMTLPSFVVQAALTKVEALEPAMTTAGYDADTITLVTVMATCVVAAAGAPRQVSSQSAPSGASRAFQLQANAMSALRRSLEGLDTAGTVTDIVGPDPAAGSLFLAVCG